MAKVKFSPPVEAYQGQMGTQVFQERNGKPIVGRKPNRSDREPTPAELARNERFREAVDYAKGVMKRPEKRAEYEEVARRTGAPIFSLPMGDFLNPPEVREIDLAAYEGHRGDVITIVATDDHKVTGVYVEMTDGDGNPLEEGAAKPHPDSSRKWLYTATVSVPAETTVRIAVTATDVPKNTGAKETEKIV